MTFRFYPDDRPDLKLSWHGRSAAIALGPSRTGVPPPIAAGRERAPLRQSATNVSQTAAAERYAGAQVGDEPVA